MLVRANVLLSLLACVPLASSAGPHLTQPIAVSDALIRAAVSGQFETWAFATMVNQGGNDALIGVDSGDAASVVLRATTMTDAGAKMRSVLSVPVPAGSTVRMSTDAYYLAFIQAKRDFAPGDTIPATLRFSSGARIRVDFVVSEAEAGQ